MEKIPLFYPNIWDADEVIGELSKVLRTRWIGEGPKVREFEKTFEDIFAPHRTTVALNSCTAALHMAYVLAGLKAGDEVITPVFTCAATNVPLLYFGGVPKFADIEKDSLNVSVDSVKALITEKTKAIVCVPYGGEPCDMLALDKLVVQYQIPLIVDAAHCLGATYQGLPIGNSGDYVCYSFQAIKHITTGDGGMLVVPNDQKALASRLRWFGIDREAKYKGTWSMDLAEVGYKYHMNDIAATIGLVALRTFDSALRYRKNLFRIYTEELKGVSGVTLINAGSEQSACWMATVFADRREDLMRKLSACGIESGLAHYRNDIYSIFGGKRIESLENMNKRESQYLVLPLHTHVSEDNVHHICKTIRGGW